MNGMTEAQTAELEVPRFAAANFAPELPQIRKKSEKPPRPPVPQGRDAAAPRGRSPISGAPVPMGRQKGTPNRLTVTLKEAVERAARDCHPKGLAGWLVERAQGGVQDRQIFAGLVGKVIPIQVNQSVNGGISINLNWLGGRAIGTVSAQPRVVDAQTVELIEDSDARRWIADANSEQQAAQGLQATQQGGGYLPPSEPAIGAPAASEGLARASGAAADPPSPPKAGQGG